MIRKIGMSLAGISIIGWVVFGIHYFFDLPLPLWVQGIISFVLIATAVYFVIFRNELEENPRGKKLLWIVVVLLFLTAGNWLFRISTGGWLL